MDKWIDVADLPPPGERPGRVFVVVEGSQFHSGQGWLRAGFGIARTQNDGFYPEDVEAIARQEHMDIPTARVTHWMRINLPACPQFNAYTKEPPSDD